MLKRPLFLLLFVATAFFTGNLHAKNWEWAPLLPVGTPLPEFSLAGTDGKKLRLNELVGNQGLLLFFNRSTVW